MAYWLMKTEPGTFSVADLARRRGQRTTWDGVRNHQVRNLLRDEVRVDDLAYIYHSGTSDPGIHGVMRVVRGAFADPTQFDPASPYFDPKSARDSPTWLAVEVQLIGRWTEPVSLKTLRSLSHCRTMVALRRGNRLSITPVSAREWRAIESAHRSAQVG